MTRTTLVAVAFGLFSATALAQDSATFPTTIDGFAFGIPTRTMQRVCTTAHGTWDAGYCTIGADTPDAHDISTDQPCRGGRLCRIAVSYITTLPADDRAGWTQRFLQMKRDLEARFHSTGVQGGGQRSCYEAAMGGDASCAYEGSGNAVYVVIPVPGSNTTRGQVKLTLRYNSMRHSPAIGATWSNAAAMYEDENEHEGPYPGM